MSISLYIMNFDGSFAGHTALLHPERRAETEACKNADVRAEKTACALLLHAALQKEGAHLPPHGASPMPPHIVKDQNGKPYLSPDCGIYISLSHTKGLALCALSGAEVGADIQTYSPAILRTAPKLLRGAHGSALERLDNLSETDRIRQLTALWCKREAVAKLTGKGLAYALSLPMQPNSRRASTGTGRAVLYTRTLQHCALAAAAYAPQPVKLIRLSPGEVLRLCR